MGETSQPAPTHVPESRCQALTQLTQPCMHNCVYALWHDPVYINKQYMEEGAVERKRCFAHVDGGQDGGPAVKQARGIDQKEAPATEDCSFAAAAHVPHVQPPDGSASAGTDHASLSQAPSASGKAAATQLCTVGEAVASNETATIELHVAYSEDKGSRFDMEDVAVVNMDGRHQEQQQAGLKVRCCFMAIFDGHGGRDVAQLAAQQLHTQVMNAGLKQVLAAAAVNASEHTAGGGEGWGAGGCKVDVRAAKSAVTQGFLATDAHILQRCAAENWQDGACAVCCWAVQNTLLVANVGDAKAVLARTSDKDVGQVKAGSLRAIVLSKDHLAVLEHARVVKAGGYVTSDGRLNGRLQVSRSFGDASLKKAGCICAPHIAAFEVSTRDSFLLLACDGFWSVFEPQGAVDLAATLLAEGRGVKAVSNRLLNEAVRERKCKDNCTLLLARFA